MSNSEEDQKIKVVDRRRFSETGESAPEIQVTNNMPKETSSNKILAGEGDVEGNINSINPDSQKLDISSFFMGMYHQTLIFLGEVPNPETNLVSKNIEAARQNIDILDILEEKTKGNLNPDEAGLLGEILNNLRLLFVKKI